jgi:hypothetical protein
VGADLKLECSHAQNIVVEAKLVIWSYVEQPGNGVGLNLRAIGLAYLEP